MQANKDQIIFELKEKIHQLESQIKMLERNVREEMVAKYELMRKVGQKDHEVPKT